MDESEEDLKIPFISDEIIEFLEKYTSVESLLDVKCSNNDEHIGYIKGVNSIVVLLRFHKENQLERGV